MRLFVLLLFAVPLSAQQTQTTVVPDVEITVEVGPTPFEITVEVMPDSVRLARIADAMESLAQAIAECRCVDSGPSTVNVVANAGLMLAAFFIAWQLKGIKDKEHPEHPEPPEETKKPDYGESG